MPTASSVQQQEASDTHHCCCDDRLIMRKVLKGTKGLTELTGQLIGNPVLLKTRISNRLTKRFLELTFEFGARAHKCVDVYRLSPDVFGGATLQLLGKCRRRRRVGP